MNWCDFCFAKPRQSNYEGSLWYAWGGGAIAMAKASRAPLELPRRITQVHIHNMFKFREIRSVKSALTPAWVAYWFHLFTTLLISSIIFSPLFILLSHITHLFIYSRYLGIHVFHFGFLIVAASPVVVVERISSALKHFVVSLVQLQKI